MLFRKIGEIWKERDQMKRMRLGKGDSFIQKLQQFVFENNRSKNEVTKSGSYNAIRKINTFRSMLRWFLWTKLEIEKAILFYRFCDDPCGWNLDLTRRRKLLFSLSTFLAISAFFICLFMKCKQTKESSNQDLYANLGYQQEISTKFQLNWTLYSWGIPSIIHQNQQQETLILGDR